MDYKKKFYQERHKLTNYSAETILNIVKEFIPPVNSAVDFGCGVGTWLSVLEKNGAKKVLGFDGPWVDEELLEIPKESFIKKDFEQGILLDEKFDLAISLEVAEHLRPEFAESFVKSLSNASDFVLFSAAIPFQEGRNHFNEQWPKYWIEIFKKMNYHPFDLIRKKIWDDVDIPVWYRQNIILFVNKDRVSDVNFPKYDVFEQFYPADLVHPESFVKKLTKLKTTKGSFKAFKKSLFNKK